MKKWLWILLPIFFIGACAMPETRIYSLYVPIDSGKTIHTKVDASIAIMINSPRHLTQPYIVYRKSPYQLEISRYSKWDESPEKRLCEVFKEAVSSIGIFKEIRVTNSLPGGYYSLMINLKKFERSDSGNDSFSELVFDVNFISPDDKKLFQSTISKKSKLDDRTFLSLTKGLSNGLTEGVEEVKNRIEMSLKAHPH
jgi:uncharacterized lipoprotein YmbA